jgi:hypothetical protein
METRRYLALEAIRHRYAPEAPEPSPDPLLQRSQLRGAPLFISENDLSVESAEATSAAPNAAVLADIVQEIQKAERIIESDDESLEYVDVEVPFEPALSQPAPEAEAGTEPRLSSSQGDESIKVLSADYAPMSIALVPKDSRPQLPQVATIAEIPVEVSATPQEAYHGREGQLGSTGSMQLAAHFSRQVSSPFVPVPVTATLHDAAPPVPVASPSSHSETAKRESGSGEDELLIMEDEAAERRDESEMAPAAEAHAVTPSDEVVSREPTPGTGDVEEPVEWSPSPPSRAHGHVDEVVQPLEDFPLLPPGELEEETEEDIYGEHEIEEAEANMQQEQGQFATFFSQLQNRNLEDMRHEIQNEIRTLQQQHKKDRRNADDITQQMSKEIRVRESRASHRTVRHKTVLTV